MTGFPSGYFIVISLASFRALDVEGRRVEEDGTEIILHPATDTSLDDKIRNPWNDNQVFFIDESGHIRAKASHFPLDINEDRLVVRSEDMVAEHNISLPRFSYSQDTKQITVIQAPSALDLQHSATKGDKTYLLTSIPKSNPRVTFEDGLYALLPPSGAYNDDDPDEDEDEDEEEEDNEDDNDGGKEEAAKNIAGVEDYEIDDSLDWFRRVQVVSEEEREKKFVTEKAKQRLTWKVVALSNAAVRL